MGGMITYQKRVTVAFELLCNVLSPRSQERRNTAMVFGADESKWVSMVATIIA